jgi:hypothetical protein
MVCLTVVLPEANPTYFNHSLATAAIKVNSVLQIASATIAFGVNVAILFVVQYGLHPKHVILSQTNGAALFTASFFVLTGYFGVTAGKTGSNRRIISYLCLCVLCLCLSFLEGSGSCYAIAARDYEMMLPDRENCTYDKLGYR